MSHIMIDCHPANKNDMVIAAIRGHVLVLDIKYNVLKPKVNHKNLHAGCVMNMRIFMNKVLTCGEDGSIKCFKYKE